MSVYLGVFLDEVDEQLNVLEEEVLNLEQDPGNLETIQRIFRAAHTLKGSSASMGMKKMESLTHKMENVLDLIRNQKLTVDTSMINMLFECIDTIKILKNAILCGTLESINTFDLTEKLKNIQNQENGQIITQTKIHKDENQSVETVFPEVIFDEYQLNMVENAFKMNMNVIAVYVAINDNTMLKSVRAFLIHNNLKEIGEIIASFPSPDIIENEETFNGTLAYIIVTHSNNQEVFNIVNSISDIKAVHLTQITSSNLESFSIGKKMEIVEQIRSQPDTKLKVQKTIRVNVDHLEHLLNLVGELVIDQTRLADVRGRLSDRYTNDADIEGFQEISTHLGQIISDLHEGMMKTRMLPIQQLFDRFPRMVRDIAQKANKEINFVMEGKETELDRNLIEEIGDPIIHLLRNSIDHGIETPDERELVGKPRIGTVTLKAAHEENHIAITISDDGKGIDAEKIKQTAIKKHLISEEEGNRMTEKDLIFLIFKSGISTAKKVTDISGRGVGMDIVRSHIEKLNGMIDIKTVLGEGTTFTIKLPLTLAIIRSLLVRMGEKQFALPLANVQEIIRINRDEIKTIQNQEVGIVRNRVLPLVRLHRRFNASEDELRKKKRLFVVVVGLAEKRVGIIIDNTLGNQEVVIKPLGKYIGTPKHISGATIMGDGNVALILDIASIVAEEGTTEDRHILQDKEALSSTNSLQLTTFKLGEEEYGIEINKVKDIITVPDITSIINSPFSIIGMMNLREDLIPVMDLRQRFGLSQQEQTRKTRIIVVEVQEERMGLLVDQVTQVLKVNEDTLEVAPEKASQVDQAYIRGICHLQDRLIILLNIDHAIKLEEPVTLRRI